MYPPHQLRDCVRHESVVDLQLVIELEQSSFLKA